MAPALGAGRRLAILYDTGVAYFSDEALVLDCHPYQDRHVVLAVLTPESGVIRGIVRRARGAKAPQGAATQVLSRLKVELFQRAGAELATFRQIDLITTSYPLVESLERAASGAVVAELLLCFCPPGEPAPLPFRLGTSVLDALLAGCDPQVAVAYSQLWTIILHGLLPPLHLCADCGTQLENGCLLRPSDAHPLCRHCAPVEAEGLSLDAVRFLALCRRLPISQVPEILPGDCSRWLDRLTRCEAERSLRALDFFRRHV